MTHLHDTQASSSVKASTSAKDGADKVSEQGQSGPKEDDNLADMSDEDEEPDDAVSKGDAVEILNNEQYFIEIQSKLWDEKRTIPEGVRDRYMKQLGGRGTFLKRDEKRSSSDDEVYQIQTPYGKQSWHRRMVRKIPFDEKAEKVSTVREQRRVLQKKQFMGRAYIDPYKALKTREKYRQLDLHSESKYKVDYEDPPAEWVKLYDSTNDDRVCVGEVFVQFVLLSKSSANQQPEYPAFLFAGSSKDGFRKIREPFPKLRPYKAFLGMQMLSQIPLHVPLLVKEQKRDEEGKVAPRRGKNKPPDRVKFLMKCSVPPAHECRKYMDLDGYKDVSAELSELKFTHEVSCSMECQGVGNPATRAVLVNQVLEVDVPMPPTNLSRKHAPALTVSIGTTRRPKVEATLVLLLGDYLKVSTTGVPSEKNGWVDSKYEPANEYPFFVRGGSIEAYHRHKRKQFGVTGTFSKTDVAMVKERYNYQHIAVDPSKCIPADINQLNTEYGHEINDDGWRSIEQALLEPEENLNDKDDPLMSETMITLQTAEIDWPADDADVNLEGLEDGEDQETYEAFIEQELETHEGYKQGLDTWPLLIGYASNRPRSLWQRLTSRSRTSMGIVGCLKGKVAVVSRKVSQLGEYAYCFT